MEFEKYCEKIARIHKELQAIAEQTANQAMLSSANPSNPMFIDLMRRHEQLVSLATKLNEKMLAERSGI